MLAIYQSYISTGNFSVVMCGNIFLVYLGHFDFHTDRLPSFGGTGEFQEEPFLSTKPRVRLATCNMCIIKHLPNSSTILTNCHHARGLRPRSRPETVLVACDCARGRQPCLWRATVLTACNRAQGLRPCSRPVTMLAVYNHARSL